MDKIISWIEGQSVSIWLLLAGFFGSLLSLKDKKGLSNRDKVFSVMSGMAIALFVTALLFEYLNINKGAIGGGGFLLGYAGLESMKWAILQIKKKFKQE